MTNNAVIVIQNLETKKYFIAPKHSNYGLSGYVPVTYRFPVNVIPTEYFFHSHLGNAEDIIAYHYPASENWQNITETDEIMEVLTRPDGDK